MRISSLAKVLVPIVALLISIPFFSITTHTSYASVLAAETAATEPPTRTPTPQNMPGPTDTPTPQNTTGPTDTPTPQNTTGPTDTPQPQATIQPTNTPPRDVDNNKKGVSISLRKTVNVQQLTVGSTLEFTLVANNTGDETAQDVVVRDPLPAFLQLVGATSSQGSVNIDGNTVVVNIGAVGPGATVTIIVTATLVSVPQPPDNRNVAVLTTTSQDNNADNQASVEVRSPESGSSNQVSTPVLPSETPLPSVTLTTVPVVPTPVPPATLPPTGSSGGSTIWLLLASVGAASITLGILLRRRNGLAR